MVWKSSTTAIDVECVVVCVCVSANACVLSCACGVQCSFISNRTHSTAVADVVEKVNFHISTYTNTHTSIVRVCVRMCIESELFISLFQCVALKMTASVVNLLPCSSHSPFNHCVVAVVAFFAAVDVHFMPESSWFVCAFISVFLLCFACKLLHEHYLHHHHYYCRCCCSRRRRRTAVVAADITCTLPLPPHQTDSVDLSAVQCLNNFQIK